MKEIRIDHTYTSDKNHKFFKSLELKGFKLLDLEVKHPGKATCRFITFSDNSKRENTYLEFVSVGKNGKPFSVPGLSFSMKKDLEIFYHGLKRKVKCHFMHKNYEWQKNDVDRLPGWNYLTFKKPPIRNVYIWFSEYEPNPKLKKRFIRCVHPNTVYDIHGIQMSLTDKGKKYLEKLLRVKITTETPLPDGRTLYYHKGRVSKLENIILKCKSLKKANKYVKSSIVDFKGHESLLITNTSENHRNWNLVIIEA